MEEYFQRVNKLSATRFWINNPTLEEVDKALSSGAIACTTNPTYAAKMIGREETRGSALRIVDEVVAEISDDHQAADMVQQRLVQLLMKKFLPLHQRENRKVGFVSIQGSPYSDGNTDAIIDEACRYRRLGENFIAKIPATQAGLEAIKILIGENIPIIATEIMSLDQAVSVCELYKQESISSGNRPPLFITHITGIFDEYLANQVQERNIEISSDILWQAGCAVARKQYRLLKGRGYDGIMLGGGARGVHHFTEMVGSEMHITINWRGTADRLIKENPPVVYRMDTPVPEFVIEELAAKLPDFKKAYYENSLDVSEYLHFGPVQLFRNYFVKGWKELLHTIKERRKAVNAGPEKGGA